MVITMYSDADPCITADVIQEFFAFGYQALISKISDSEKNNLQFGEGNLDLIEVFEIKDCIWADIVNKEQHYYCEK